MRIIVPPTPREKARRREAPQRLAMATLVVDSLGLGTGKHEGGVDAELFAAFGLDLAALEAAVPQHAPDRASELRKLAAEKLSREASNTGAIVAELTRTSSFLMAMVRQVYELLCEHDATTKGTTKQFSILPSDVDDVELTLSPAFFEKVTHLLTRTVTYTLSTLDSSALSTFVGFDGGVLCGQWPVKNSDFNWASLDHFQAGKYFSLAAGVLHLSEAVQHLEARTIAETGWEDTASLANEALKAAERLVQQAEHVVTGFASQLDDLDITRPVGVSAVEYVAEHAYGVDPDSPNEVITREVERYLRDRFLGAMVWFPDGGDRVAYEVGMTNGKPIVNTGTDDWYHSSSVAALAAWCGMFRDSRDPGMRIKELEQLSTPHEWTTWLGRLKNACMEATAWFRTTLVLLQEEITGERVFEEVKQLLNLPLWQHRDLLYEVWLLSATLRACEQAGWTTTLTGLDPATQAWVLPKSRAMEPVAYLDSRSGGERLEVWREPLRTYADNRQLTPDVTITVPGTHPRDLVVVEAKDRIKMAEGSALEYARRYADGLSPRLTWVCNHCDFRTLKTQRFSSLPALEPAKQNHGDPWHAIHIAELFRPGSVPAAFAETIKAAIRPLNAADSARPVSECPCFHGVGVGGTDVEGADTSLDQPAATGSTGGYLRRAFSILSPRALFRRPTAK